MQVLTCILISGIRFFGLSVDFRFYVGLTGAGGGGSCDSSRSGENILKCSDWDFGRKIVNSTSLEESSSSKTGEFFL